MRFTSLGVVSDRLSARHRDQASQLAAERRSPPRPNPFYVKHLSEISACRRDPAPKLLIRLQPVRGASLKDCVHVKSSIVFGVSLLLFPLAAMAANPEDS